MTLGKGMRRVGITTLTTEDGDVVKRYIEEGFGSIEASQLVLGALRYLQQLLLRGWQQVGYLEKHLVGENYCVVGDALL